MQAERPRTHELKHLASSDLVAVVEVHRDPDQLADDELLQSLLLLVAFFCPESNHELRPCRLQVKSQSNHDGFDVGQIGGVVVSQIVQVRPDQESGRRRQSLIEIICGAVRVQVRSRRGGVPSCRGTYR